jgi:hypothetical protein
MSSSWLVTTTCSDVAVSGTAVAVGMGLEAAGAGFCAVALLTQKSSTAAVGKTFFI